MTGVDIQKDLLESLGDQWSAYIDPATAGNGLLGFVIVNKLNKPADFQQAIGKLAKFVEDLSRKEMARDRMQLSFNTAKSGNVEINYLSVPFVSPSWAFVDGNLYVGLYPQVVAAATQNLAGRKSILDNEDFIALRNAAARPTPPASASPICPRASATTIRRCC